MKQCIRIGTRDSKLALWQAEQVEKKISEAGFETKLIPVKSEGDTSLIEPLYALNIQGIFTRSLDIALLNNQIDVAVHSFKDVPSELAEGTCIAGVLERDDWRDLLIYKNQLPETDKPYTLATSSVRRRAQWQYKYKGHHFENIRGNVQTRLQKLAESTSMDATILSKAGLDRLEIKVENSLPLDWMLPAPSQGTVVFTCLNSNKLVLEICNAFNHQQSLLCTVQEKEFLRHLQGGCTKPISALAQLDANGNIHFKGSIFSLDGMIKVEAEKTFMPEDFFNAGYLLAQEIIESGGAPILESYKGN